MGGGTRRGNATRVRSREKNLTCETYDVYYGCWVQMHHEKIEILNYDTSSYSEHVFRLDGTPGV